MRLRFIAATIFLLGAVLVATPGRADAKQKLAVLGIETDDASDATADTTANLARWITQSMRARAQKTTGKFEVPTSANKDLGEMKLVTDCLDEKADCMAQMGKDLGVERMVYGKLTKTKAGWTLTLRYLNVQTRSFEGRTYEKQIPTADGNEDAVKRIGSNAFGELTGTASSGSIEIQANVDSGTIYVDGSARGAVHDRVASIPDLAEGSYNIAVEAEGHKRWEKTVLVRAGEPILVIAELEAETVGGGGGGEIGGGGGGGDEPVDGVRPGGTSRKLFWTSLVVTAGGVAAFTVTGLKVREYEDQKIEAIIAAGNMAPPPFTSGSNRDACADADAANYAPVQGPCEDGKKMATVTNVLIGVTAVAAVAAGFFYYKGYIAADKPSSNQDAAARRKRQQRARRTVKPSTVTVTPQIYTNGAGLGAVFTF